MYYDYTFQPYKFIFKIEVTYNIVLLFLQILLYLIKLMGNNITPYYLPYI